MITSVDLALRQRPTLANLELSSRIISNFLGSPPNLLLSEACEIGSIALLDWIWSSSCTSPRNRTPGWSLTNYLRSDPHHHRWQFTKSLCVAVKRGDMEIVEWLFAHFVSCEAPTGVVRAAADNGHLHILRYLWEYRSRPEESDINPKNTIFQDIGFRDNITCKVKFDEWCCAEYWGETAITKALENGQLVECLNVGMKLSRKDRQIAIDHAVNIGQNELAESLLLEGTRIYVNDTTRPEIIREILDRGRLQWREKYAASTMKNAAKWGSVELLQDIFQLHSPVLEEHTLWETAWWGAFNEACSYNNLKVVKWLVDHSLIRDLIDEMKKGEPQRRSYNVLLAAVEAGHVEVMQYLLAKGFAYFNPYLTRVTIQKNNLVAMKWLADNVWIDNPRHFNYATAEAAKCGRLEVLEFARSWNRLQTYETLGNRRRETSDRTFEWSPHLIFWAARNGHIHVLEWLHKNRSDTTNFEAMDVAASGGHLNTVKWLHVNRSEGCSSDALRCAVEYGHFEVVKWVYENRPESHYSDVLAHAIRFGQTRTACWLRKKLPAHTVTDYFVPSHKRLIRGCWQDDNVMETFLFLHVFYPDVFTAKFLRTLREEFASDYQHPHTVELVLGWLDANYPSTTATTS